MSDFHLVLIKLFSVYVYTGYTLITIDLIREYFNGLLPHKQEFYEYFDAIEKN